MSYLIKLERYESFEGKRRNLSHWHLERLDGIARDNARNFDIHDAIGGIARDGDCI